MYIGQYPVVKKFRKFIFFTVYTVQGATEAVNCVHEYVYMYKQLIKLEKSTQSSAELGTRQFVTLCDNATTC